MISTLDERLAALALAVEELDLEPVVFKLTQPGPGVPGMPLPDADRLVVLYRCYLTLCAWYPDEHLVPPRSVDEVWRAHILDTQAYAADCEEVFGCFLHHFPYLGLRGDVDAQAWQAAFARTCALFREHFGMSFTAEAGSSCNGCPDPSACRTHGGGMCVQGGWDKSFPGSSGRERLRPDRTLITA